jgi:hypothetical protein
MIEQLIVFVFFVKAIDKYFFEKPSNIRWAIGVVFMCCVSFVLSNTTWG